MLVRIEIVERHRWEPVLTGEVPFVHPCSLHSLAAQRSIREATNPNNQSQRSRTAIHRLIPRTYRLGSSSSRRKVAGSPAARQGILLPGLVQPPFDQKHFELTIRFILVRL